jgi:hypothetical protein
VLHRPSRCPTYLHAISLAAAEGVASAILKHMVAVGPPISGKRPQAVKYNICIFSWPGKPYVSARL